MSSKRIAGDLDRIVEAAAQSIDRRLTYEQALRDHFARLRVHSQGFMFSLDGIQAEYRQK